MLGRRRIALRAAAVALAATASGLACQALIGLEDPSGEAVIKQEAGPPEAAPPARRDDCVHARPADPPTVDDDAGGVLPPFWVAARRFELGVSPDGGLGDGGAPGLDLDGVCSCFGEGDPAIQTEYDAAGSCVARFSNVGRACDERNGIDNAVYRVVQPYTATYNVDRLAGVSARMAAGQLGVLFWIANYNGLANDKSVTVGAVVSPGLFSKGACGGVRDIDAGVEVDGGELPHAAFFDGCDEWSVDESLVAVGGGTIVPTRVSDGYVKDSMLVVRGGALAAPFVAGGNLVDLRAPLIQAKLIRKGDSFALDGVVAGRLPPVAMLRALSNLQLSGVPLCKIPFIFDQLRASFCDNLDVNLQQALDFTGGVECDGASAAVLFSAEPAKVVGPRPAAPSTTACDTVIPLSTTVAQLCEKDAAK